MRLPFIQSQYFESAAMRAYAVDGAEESVTVFLKHIQAFEGPSADCQIQLAAHWDWAGDVDAMANSINAILHVFIVLRSQFNRTIYYKKPSFMTQCDISDHC
jgi:hypothetical protein